MERRTFLKSVGVSTAAALVGVPARSRTTAAAETGWRTFEVTSKVEVANPSGVTRVWMPLPLAAETDYHKPLGNNWKGNGAMRQHRDEKYGATLLFVEWPASEKAPMILERRGAKFGTASGLPSREWWDGFYAACSALASRSPQQGQSLAHQGARRCFLR